MVKGILSDVNIKRHVQRVIQILTQEPRRGFWDHLGLRLLSFAEIGLLANASDRIIWLKCQELELALITANRNQLGADSLESTIQNLGTASSLPVFTLANPKKVLKSRQYAEETADALLEYLFDGGRILGTGRLYIP